MSSVLKWSTKQMVVTQVFDCWFESGSMPYAYIHYPFENRELFEKNFPGNFVAEGLDQTRGWFVTLFQNNMEWYNSFIRQCHSDWRVHFLLQFVQLWPAVIFHVYTLYMFFMAYTHADPEGPIKG
jgi:hypothetical protein